jgi:hypothetical protein
MQFLADPQDKAPRVFPVGGGGRERPFVRFIQFDRFRDNLAQLLVDLGFVIPVDPSIDEPRTTPHITSVVLGPFDNLQISVTGLHLPLSSMAARTCLSWYGFASSPGLPDNVTGMELFGWVKRFLQKAYKSKYLGRHEIMILQ